MFLLAFPVLIGAMLADVYVSSKLVTRVLDQYKIPYYRMGVQPKFQPEVRAFQADFEDGPDDDELIVALTDDTQGIPDELKPYLVASRTTDVLTEGRTATTDELKKAFKTDQLEHDDPSRRSD